METIRLSKENKKQLLNWKNDLGLRYDYQIVKVLSDVFNKVYEKDKNKIVKLYSDKFNTGAE